MVYLCTVYILLESLVTHLHMTDVGSKYRAKCAPSAPHSAHSHSPSLIRLPFSTAVVFVFFRSSFPSARLVPFLFRMSHAHSRSRSMRLIHCHSQSVSHARQCEYYLHSSTAHPIIFAHRCALRQVRMSLTYDAFPCDCSATPAYVNKFQFLCSSTSLIVSLADQIAFSSFLMAVWCLLFHADCCCISVPLQLSNLKCFQGIIIISVFVFS